MRSWTRVFSDFSFFIFCCAVFRPPLSKGQSQDDGGPGVGIQWVEPMSAIGGKADIRQSLTQYRGLNVCCWGQSRRSRAALWMSAYSHKRTFAGIEIPSAQGPESTLFSHSVVRADRLLSDPNLPSACDPR